jgi:hypothetical protein
MLDITTENVTTDADVDELREVEKLFEQLEAQPAQIKNADKMDAQFQRLSARRARRAALLTLEKSGRELIDSVTSERGMAVSMAFVMSGRGLCEGPARIRRDHGKREPSDPPGAAIGRTWPR